MIIATTLLALFASAPPVDRAPHWHRAELPQSVPAATPQRIVSLAPAITETLFLLGAGDRVVGVTRFCDRPAEAQKKAKVGGYVDISLEAVLALKPDLVVAMPSLGQREVLDRLRERGIPVRVVFGDTLGEIRAFMLDLGSVVDIQKGQQEPPSKMRLQRAFLVAQLDNAVAALDALDLAQKRAAIVVGLEPLVVAGPGTFSAEALALTGLAPAYPPNAPMWPVWSLDSLAASNASILVAAEGPAMAQKLTALVERALPAGKRPRVVSASRDILMRPGPSLAADLGELARLLGAPASPESPPSRENP